MGKVSDAVATIRKDSRYIKLTKTYASNPSYRINCEQLLDEIMQLNSMRMVRRLDTSDPMFANKLVASMAQDTSFRGRASDILIQCHRIIAGITIVIKQLSSIYLISYSNTLKEFKTQREREALITCVFKDFYTFISEVETVQKSAEIFVQDIDKASWQMQSMAGIYKIHFVKEQGL